MLLIFLFIFLCSEVKTTSYNKLSLLMPDVTTDVDDRYLCSTFRIPNVDTETYIKSYESTTNSSIVHHMFVFGCRTPFTMETHYTCDKICKNEEERVLFVWAKDAKKFMYPAGVAMAVGGHTGLNYIVLQVHYLKQMKQKDRSGMILEIENNPPEYLVSIGLVFPSSGNIPGNTRHFILDISCRYESNLPAYIFAFRNHAHTLGRSIAGFKISGSSDHVDLIGKGNPQWPQTFYKPNSSLVLYPGDIFMVRCVFNSIGRDRVTVIGTNHYDEMCNYFVMLVSKNQKERLSFNKCSGNKFSDLWWRIPEYSKKYSPANPGDDLQLSGNSTLDLVIMNSMSKRDNLGFNRLPRSSLYM